MCRSTKHYLNGGEMNMYKKTLGYIIAIAYVSLLIVFSNPKALADGSKPVQDKRKIEALRPLSKIDNTDKEIVAKEIEQPLSIKKQIPRDLSKRCPQWESKFIEFGLPVELFSYIAWRESGCNEKAINAKYDKDGNVIWTLNKNGSIDRGLVQINSCWKTLTKQICGTGLDGLLKVDCNLKVAKYLYDIDGAKPWAFK